jgi:hypothetical protein
MKDVDIDIANASAAQLREALAEYSRQQQPAPAGPVAPGVTADMSPAKQDEVSTSYAREILQRPTGSWTPAEKDFIRRSAGAALREVGY